jgi:hypothetical protein
MQIHLLKDKETLSKGTLDSASRFFTTVEAITDTLCMKKVDRKKLKPRSKL